MNVVNCPVIPQEQEKISMLHGAGGKQMHDLLKTLILPFFGNEKEIKRGHDAAVIPMSQKKIAFTTDSYVIHPLFFPGGDIGKLAVCGTLNDLAMSGAIPRYLSASFILEDGFPIQQLKVILQSMREIAESENVCIVTGDTKVVEYHKGDGIYMNTSGIGLIEHDLTIHPCSIKAGDAIILSGDIGRHGMAVMVEREKLSIASSLQSDCASVSQVVQALIKADVNIHCLRDVTRGGLATTLCELANDSGYSFEVQETNIPIDQDVVSISELLGIDPFYAACEGRFVLFVPASDVSKALQVLTSFDISSLAKEIGYVVADKKSQVINCNPYGVKKLLTMLTYEGLPRIC